MTVTINHTTPADGTFSTEGAAAWDAAHAVSGLGTMAEQNANSVAITGGTISGVSGIGTVTSVAATAGTGISVTGSPITSSGTLNITNTAPDQTVVLTAGTGISTSGTYPNFTVTNSAPMNYAGAGIAVSTGSAWGTSLTAPSGTIVGTSDTQTLTNKRVTNRIGTVADAATITPTSDSSDQYNVTALAQAATIAAPSGTPTDAQRLTIRLKDNGTGRALTWTTTSGAYRAIGVTLPTTTVASKVTYVGCVYNSQDSFWDVVAVTTQA